MLEWLGLPVAASAHAGEVDHIMVLIHWLMLVLFIGWGAYFVFVLFRFRAAANPKASYTGAKGKIAQRVARRIDGKVTGRLFRRLFG